MVEKERQKTMSKAEQVLCLDPEDLQSSARAHFKSRSDSKKQKKGKLSIIFSRDRTWSAVTYAQTTTNGTERNANVTGRKFEDEEEEGKRFDVPNDAGGAGCQT
ncbi:MAG: hypothetical protein Q9159_003781 [Coniocarpon cinnabarinum]